MTAAVLRDVARLWRDHVPADDPLAGYADTLDHPAYEQTLSRLPLGVPRPRVRSR